MFFLHSFPAFLTLFSGELQEIVKTQRSSSPSSTKQSDAHAAHIVVALQSKLATASNSFKDVLEARTHNMKAQRDRREQFSASVAAPARVGCTRCWEKGRGKKGKERNSIW